MALSFSRYICISSAASRELFKIHTPLIHLSRSEIILYAKWAEILRTSVSVLLLISCFSQFQLVLFIKSIVRTTILSISNFDVTY